jgi:hypothetical protein
MEIVLSLFAGRFVVGFMKEFGNYRKAILKLQNLINSCMCEIAIRCVICFQNHLILKAIQNLLRKKIALITETNQRYKD